MNYRQHTKDIPSIKPFGFTGIISKNSNLTIDKSYIEKGTSFINAFDNSNVILKDCGTPIPSTTITYDFISDLNNQLKLEKDSIKLPPWIEYNVSRFNKSTKGKAINLVYSNKSIIYLDDIENVSDEITNIRNNVISSMTYDTAEGCYVSQYKNMPQLVMNQNGIDTSNVSVTANGVYILNNVESSIRAVWPLDAKHLTDDLNPDIDNPRLNIHFANREFIKLQDSNNNEIFVNGMYKTDKFGNKKKDLSKTEIIYANNTKKKIVKSVNNELITEKYAVKIPKYNEFYYLVLNEFNEKKYITGPYFNNKNYVSYYKQDKNSGNLDDVVLTNDNDGQEATFYFKYKDHTYSLYKFINGEYNSDLYINEITSLFINNEKITNNYIFLDKIERIDCSEYQPKNYKETVSHLGFKNNNFSNQVYEIPEIIVDNSIFDLRAYLLSSLSNLNESELSPDKLQCFWVDNNTLSTNVSAILLNNNNENISAEINSGLTKLIDSVSYSQNLELTGNFTLTQYELKIDSITSSVQNYSVIDFLNNFAVITSYLSSCTLKNSNNIPVSANVEYTKYNVTKISPSAKYSLKSKFNNDYILSAKNSNCKALIFNFTEDSQNTKEIQTTVSISSEIALNKELEVVDSLSNYNPSSKIFENVKLYINENDTTKSILSTTFNTDKNIVSLNSSAIYIKENDNYYELIIDGITSGIIDDTGELTNEQLENFSIVKKRLSSYEEFYPTSFNKKQITDSTLLEVLRRFFNSDKTLSGTLYKTYFVKDINTTLDKNNFTKNYYDSSVITYKASKKANTSLSSIIEVPYVSSYINQYISDLNISNYRREVSSLIENKSDTKVVSSISDIKSCFTAFKSTYSNPEQLNSKYNNFNKQTIIDKVGEIAFAIDDTNSIDSAINQIKNSNEYFTLNNNDTISINIQLKLPQSISDITWYDVSDSSVSAKHTISNYKINFEFNKTFNNVQQTDKLYSITNVSILDSISSTLSTYIDDISNVVTDREISSLIINNISSDYEEITLYQKMFDKTAYKNMWFDGQTYIFNDLFNTDSNGYITTLSNQKLIKNESYLDKSMFNGTPIISAYLSNSELVCELNLISDSIQTESYLGLFFDEKCKIPFEIDSVNNYMYDHTINGKKIYADSENIAAETSNGVITKFNYKYANEFVYEQNIKYYLANFNDWYDVDTYINYSNLNMQATSGAYHISCIGKQPAYNDYYAVLTGNTTFVISSDIKSNTYPVYSTNNINYVVNDKDYNISSLFAQEDTTYLGYKALSFNFKIPTDGWKLLNDKMYKKANEYQIQEIPESGLLYPEQLKKSEGIGCYVFEGIFKARYRNLKSGSLSGENAIGINRYITEIYEVPFIACVKETTSSQTDRKLFTMTSNKNESLCFSTYIDKVDDKEEEVFETIHTLKYLNIDYVSSETNQSGKIQLNNINLLIRYSNKNGLVLTTISNDSSIGYEWLSGDLISGITYDNVLNDYYPADNSFIADFDNSLVMPNKINYEDPKILNEIYQIKEQMESTTNSGLIEIYKQKLIKEYMIPSANITYKLVNSYIKNYETLKLDSSEQTNTKFNYNNIITKSRVSSVLSTSISGLISGLTNFFNNNNNIVYDIPLNSSKKRFNRSTGTINFSNFNNFSLIVLPKHNPGAAGYFTAFGDNKNSNNLEFKSYWKGHLISDEEWESDWKSAPGSLHLFVYGKFNFEKSNADVIKSINYENIRGYERASCHPVNYSSDTAYCKTSRHIYLDLSKSGLLKQLINNDKEPLSTKIPQYVVFDNKVWKLFLCSPYFYNTNSKSTDIYWDQTDEVSNNCLVFSYRILENTSVNSLNSDLISISEQYVVDIQIPSNEEPIKFHSDIVYGNLINDVKSSDNYFITWMTPGDMMFVTKDKSSTILSSTKLDDKIKSIDSYALSSVNSESKFISYVTEPFVEPFDMSTNLLYYKGSSTKDLLNSDGLANDDEVFIINAKKMYNEVDAEDKKPDDGGLTFNYDSLYNTELTLTGEINASEVELDKMFEKQHFWVNKNYEYIMNDGEDLTSEGYTEVRYTDMLNDASQWQVFKLKDIVEEALEFTTVNDVQLYVTPENNNFSEETNEYDLLNSFTIPCKLKMTFKDLLFKQQIRTATSYDNVKNIDYDTVILDKSIVEKSDIKILSSRWNLKTLSSQMIIPYKKDGTLEKENNLSSLSDYGCVADFSEYLNNAECYLGGSKYYNDVTSMVQVKNSVNKWSSNSYDKKYDKLYVFSDYAPANRGNGVIGTPYLNMDRTVTIQQRYDDTEEGSYLMRAEVAKVATDLKNIVNIKSTIDIDSMDVYPNPTQYIHDIEITEIIQSNICTINLSAIVNDTSLKGIVYFDIINNIVSNNKDDLKSCFIVNFDGLIHEKDVYIDENCNKTSSLQYKLLCVNSNTLSLSNDGILSGSIEFQISEINSINDNRIEIHNIKPISPTLNSFALCYSDSLEIDKYGAKLNNEIWSKHINLITDKFSHKLSEFKPYFSLQTSNDIRSEIAYKYDENNKITGLYITLKLKGLQAFDKASYRYYLDNPSSIVLSSESLLESYKSLSNYVASGFSIENYTENAQLNDTVLIGNLKTVYNYIRTLPFIENINIGSYNYVYNPIGDSNFQIEILKKSNGVFTGDLYYVNLPTDKWYNLTLYKYQKNADENNLTLPSGYYKISLTPIEGESITDITEKSKEIFSVFTANEKILDGLNIESDIKTNRELSTLVVDNMMHNFTSTNDIIFDKFNRYLYNGKYYESETKYAAYVDDIFTESDYEERNGHDLRKLSNSLNYNNINFKNQYAKIMLFANDEIDKLNINEQLKYNYSEFTNNVGNDVKSMLTGYIPRTISYNGSSTGEYYILKSKDFTYHITPISGMCCKSLMWIATPDLSIKANNCQYYDMFYEAQDAVDSYKDYFNNPQHKLPPVYYTNRILDSDYATLIYNACEKTSGFKNIISIDNVDSSHNVIYNYVNNPNTIAYVWDNSQVTRNETYSNGVQRESKLYWVKSSNAEYSSEIGSIYNFQNLTSNTTNIVNIEAGSINQRQTTLMPVISTPLSFEKKSDEQGIVSINDTIIATAALGYNANGYPLNGVMIYNSNGSIMFDTAHTTYLYIAQNEQQSNCKFGATQEKPIYVDTVQENIEAHSEKFEFLPDPEISKYKTSSDYDIPLQNYFGGNIDENTINYQGKQLFEVGSNLSGYSDNTKDILNSVKYYGTIGTFESYSMYNYTLDKIISNNIGNTTSNVKYAMFMCNTLGTYNNSKDAVNTDIFNVFFDSDRFNITFSNKSTSKKWITKNCYYFDGCLIPSSVAESNFNKIPNGTENSGYTNEIINDCQLIYNATDIEIEPSMAVIWLSDIDKPVDFKSYNEEISMDLTDKSGHAIFDNYFSCNLTGVKLTIDKSDLITAPIYIKIYVLKAFKSNTDNTIKFEWKNDSTLDIDLRDTYKSEYDYSSAFDKEIDHQFIAMPDNLDLTKNVFGIKFVIKQIIPQNNEFNSCSIKDIKVYASNILNKYGQAIAVEDIYVRKNDANCRNFYDMKVNEYVWQLPKTVSEWHSVYDILNDDVQNNKEYINENAWAQISGIISGIIDGNNTNNIDKQINSDGTDFSLLNTYYITNGNSSSNLMTNILSDNYLNENENMSITWKYVDYVYVYYSTNSTSSRHLLNKYFSNSIYDAVKNKLNSNIESMNANSAFSDRFKFSGGIAVQKGEVMDTTTNSVIFDWKSNNRTVYDWAEVFTTTEYNYITEKYITNNIYTNKYKGNKLKATTLTGSESRFESETKKVYDTKATIEARGSTYISNATVVNPRYESVNSWIASFQPIQIKYRIN